MVHFPEGCLLSSTKSSSYFKFEHLLYALNNLFMADWSLSRTLVSFKLPNVLNTIHEKLLLLSVCIPVLHVTLYETPRTKIK